MCSFKLLWICLNSKPSIQVISGKDQLLENELKICWFSRTTYPHRLCHVVCIGNSFHAMKAHPIVYAFTIKEACIKLKTWLRGKNRLHCQLIQNLPIANI